MHPELAGPWCCREAELRSILAADPSMMVARSTPGRGAAYDLTAGVATVAINGLLIRGGSWWFDSTDPDAARMAIVAAVRDTRVNAILLSISSPGGKAWGLQELAATVRAAAEHKPLVAHITDVGASGAYWIARQATKIAGNAMAHVGSIGTFVPLVDSSGAAAQAGYRVHLVSTGAHKGLPFPGVKIEQATIDEVQRIVNQVNGFFVADVQAGRKMSPSVVRQVTDGRIHLGTDAKRMGLIDVVQPFEQTFHKLAAAAAQQPAISNPAGNGQVTKGRKMFPDAKAEVESRVVEYLQSHAGASRAAAQAAVLRADPELRERFVVEHNEQHAKARR
jgi:signal peptide peptidase SppA